jgi:hypothetical protein
MANTFGPNTWKIDTAATLTADKRNLRRLEFVPNAAADAVKVTDGSDNLLWEVTSALAGGRAGVEGVDYGSGKEVNGIKVATLGSSCVLYLYF